MICFFPSFLVTIISLELISDTITSAVVKALCIVDNKTPTGPVAIHPLAYNPYRKIILINNKCMYT